MTSIEIKDLLEMARNPKLRDPATVFTPRGEKVTEMYVSRAGLEETLERAIRQPKHIVIHGESGCGKSWLYKKVFAKSGVRHCTVNLGGIHSAGSLRALLESTLARYKAIAQVGYSEEKSAAVNAVLAEGQLAHTKEFAVRERDAFERLLAAIRKEAGSRSAVIVFENLEHILHDQKALNELKGLLLLVDDENYSKYDIRIVLVTTASDFRAYLAAIDRANTVTNRVYELPEVGRLPPRQTNDFIVKGLFNLLGVAATSDLTQKNIIDWVAWYSDRVPQYLHELCLEVVLASQRTGRVVTDDVLRHATITWLRASLVSEMTVVESNLNSIATRVGRKNQVIYALGKCKDEEFDHSKIERLVRDEFPDSCANVTLNVSKSLSDLASSKMPLIRKLPHGTGYRFVDPKYRILVRWKLTREDGEVLGIRPFDKAIAF